MKINNPAEIISKRKHFKFHILKWIIRIVIKKINVWIPSEEWRIWLIASNPFNSQIFKKKWRKIIISLIRQSQKLISYQLYKNILHIMQTVKLKLISVWPWIIPKIIHLMNLSSKRQLHPDKENNIQLSLEGKHQEDHRMMMNNMKE